MIKNVEYNYKNTENTIWKFTEPYSVNKLYMVYVIVSIPTITINTINKVNYLNTTNFNFKNLLNKIQMNNIMHLFYRKLFVNSYIYYIL